MCAESFYCRCFSWHLVLNHCDPLAMASAENMVEQGRFPASQIASEHRHGNELVGSHCESPLHAVRERTPRTATDPVLRRALGIACALASAAAWSNMSLLLAPGHGVVCLARWLSTPTTTSKQEPAAASGEVVHKPSAFEAECIKLSEGGDMKPLASKLRVALLEQLASAKEPDVRNAFAVYLELLMQWQLFAEQAEGLASELESSKMRPEVACALLHSLYSQAQQHGTLKLRFSLLLSLIKFCAKSDNLSKVLGPIDARVGRVERWVSEWELTESQQKQLWALVFDTHAEDGRILYESSLKYFALHEDADLKASPELRERIVKALLITIRSPDLVRAIPMPFLPSHRAHRGESKSFGAHALRICARTVALKHAHDRPSLARIGRSFVATSCRSRASCSSSRAMPSLRRFIGCCTSWPATRTASSSPSQGRPPAKASWRATSCPSQRAVTRCGYLRSSPLRMLTKR